MRMYISKTGPILQFSHTFTQVYISLFTALQYGFLIYLSIAPDNDCKEAET